MGVILRCKLMTHNEYNVRIATYQSVPNFLCHVSALILFDLVHSWESYHKKMKKGELFTETQCIIIL